jgi:hypothetical protein
MGFGAAADVATQIATEKSINPRRQSAESSRLTQQSASLAGSFDITDGELIEDVVVAGLVAVPHNLGRVPTGAFVILASGIEAVVCLVTTASEVTLGASGTVTVTIWVA